MISLENVSKVYPRKGDTDVVALDAINLEIPSGEIHAIVGQSGAGKSTLIRCLTALELPSNGSITVDGEDLSSLSAGKLRRARRRIGMVFQGANLLEARTARENIEIPLKLAKLPKAERKARVDELLEVVGLSERANSYPSQLSGGQRQRVGIARALADRPSVLLCDEPTSALDTETTNQILDLLKSIRDTYGVTVLIITHEMGVVRRICDAVTSLESGRIVASGRVSDVVADVDSTLSRQIISLPLLDETAAGTQAVIDIAFTSHPGKPTGSAVLELVREFGADIGAGTFETIEATQVARLTLTLDRENVPAALDALAKAGVLAEVRA